MQYKLILLLCNISIPFAFSFVVPSCQLAGKYHLQTTICSLNRRYSGFSQFFGTNLGSYRKQLRVAELRSGAASDTIEYFGAGDVVQFLNSKGQKSVAVVESFEDDGAVLIPLVKREGLGNECYLDESQPRIKVQRGSCSWVNAYPSQRVAWSSSSPHFNPHGYLPKICIESL